MKNVFQLKSKYSYWIIALIFAVMVMVVAILGSGIYMINNLDSAVSQQNVRQAVDSQSFRE